MLKNILLTLPAICSLTAFAGGTDTPVPIDTPPAPTAAAPKEEPTDFALEVTGLYGRACKELFKNDGKRFDLWGPELTAVWEFNRHHAFTLRAGALFGRHSHYIGDENVSLGKLDLSLMPGYRFNYSVSRDFSLFAGANAGVLFTDINRTHTYDINLGGDESAWGVAGSVELGCRYHVNDDWELLLAYQYSADTARPRHLGVRQAAQSYNSIRMGVKYNF